MGKSAHTYSHQLARLHCNGGLVVDDANTCSLQLGILESIKRTDGHESWIHECVCHALCLLAP